MLIEKQTCRAVLPIFTRFILLKENVYQVSLYTSVGCQDDDCCRHHLRHLLVAVPHLLHHIVALPGDQPVATHSRSVPWHLLASYVERHVQSHHLLLDEFQVAPSFALCPIQYLSSEGFWTISLRRRAILSDYIGMPA